MESEELVASRGKTALFLLGCLIFVAIAVLLPDRGGDTTWRWLCGGFFGVGAVVLAITMIRPHRLTMDATGFTMVAGLTGKERRVAWADVTQFFVLRMAQGAKAVAYDLTDAARPDTYMGDINRRFGADGTLPATFPGSPETIAAMLEARRVAAMQQRGA